MSAKVRGGDVVVVVNDSDNGNDAEVADAAVVLFLFLLVLVVVVMSFVASSITFSNIAFRLRCCCSPCWFHLQMKALK